MLKMVVLLIAKSYEALIYECQSHDYHSMNEQNWRKGNSAASHKEGGCAVQLPAEVFIKEKLKQYSKPYRKNNIGRNRG